MERDFDKTCFVIMPFGAKGSPEERDHKDTYQSIIRKKEIEMTYKEVIKTGYFSRWDDYLVGTVMVTFVILFPIIICNDISSEDLVRFCVEIFSSPTVRLISFVSVIGLLDYLVGRTGEGVTVLNCSSHPCIHHTNPYQLHKGKRHH